MQLTLKIFFFFWDRVSCRPGCLWNSDSPASPSSAEIIDVHHTWSYNEKEARATCMLCVCTLLSELHLHSITPNIVFLKKTGASKMFQWVETWAAQAWQWDSSPTTNIRWKDCPLTSKCALWHVPKWNLEGACTGIYLFTSVLKFHLKFPTIKTSALEMELRGHLSPGASLDERPLLWRIQKLRAKVVNGF